MVIQGIIRPPPEIRAVADRTALYVSKNGRAFEKKILASEKGKQPKFAFLHETSPFHAYYENRVQFYENGGEDETEGKEMEKQAEDRASEKPVEKENEKLTKEKRAHRVASVADPVAKALLAQRANIAQFRKATIDTSDATTAENDESQEKQQAATIPPPPPLRFVNVVAPASLSLAQIETIQLVAQFTALDGRGGSFLYQLTLREWTNPEFGFCQTRHPHFAYFSALVDSYRRVLESWTESSSTSADGDKELANNTAKCLEVAAYRAEYERDQEEQRSKQDDGGALVDQVDWHNFVVVETIDFPPDEVVELSMLPPPPSQFINPLGAANKQDEMDESDEDDDRGDEQIRVVSSYQPKVVATHQQNKLETVIDPITGKRVAVQDMPEHVRIQLLDPKWAEERKKFQEKQKDSNLVSSDMVASNLERLSQTRGDAFGKKVSTLFQSDCSLSILTMNLTSFRNITIKTELVLKKRGPLLVINLI
jgi:splicing factor 3A subunit 1